MKTINIITILIIITQLITLLLFHKRINILEGSSKRYLITLDNHTNAISINQVNLNELNKLILAHQESIQRNHNNIYTTTKNLNEITETQQILNEQIVKRITRSR
jgi:hypothetical protein